MAKARVTDGGAVMRWMDEQLQEPALRARVDELLATMKIEQDLERLRRQCGLTQVQLAKRAGLSQPMIAKLESGRMQNYELRTLCRIAAAVGANVKISFEPARKGRRRKAVA
jgi:DNA-binding XRE family transcriptional regulator